MQAGRRTARAVIVDEMGVVDLYNRRRTHTDHKSTVRTGSHTVLRYCTFGGGHNSQACLSPVLLYSRVEEDGKTCSN